MLTGPMPATRLLLKRTGLHLDDIDVFEINEAFASVVLAWAKEVGADLDKVNPNGGAIALGHPLGGTGCILSRRRCTNWSASAVDTRWSRCAAAAAWDRHDHRAVVADGERILDDQILDDRPPPAARVVRRWGPFTTNRPCRHRGERHRPSLRRRSCVIPRRAWLRRPGAGHGARRPQLIWRCRPRCTCCRCAIR